VVIGADSLLEVIQELTAELGRPPRLSELAERAGISTSACFGRVDHLRKKGRVKPAERYARGIVLSNCCPTCGRWIRSRQPRQAS